MSTINFLGNLLGPLPDTSDEYLLLVKLSDHDPVEVTAAEVIEAHYSLSVDVGPIPPSFEEPLLAYIKIKHSSLQTIKLELKDSDAPQSTIQEELTPTAFTPEDVLPEEIHVFYDLSPSSVDTFHEGGHQRILPGRRTRTIQRN